MKFNGREFLRIVSGPGPMRDYLKQHQPQILQRFDTFLENTGPNCNYTIAALKIMFAEEVHKDRDGFYAQLKSAGYSP